MLHGTIDRRISNRVPFQAEVTVRLERDGEGLPLAVASNISAGGILLSLPQNSRKLDSGEIIEFVFPLPNLGDTLVKGDICYVRSGLDAQRNPAYLYGIKFIDLSAETWNYIFDYCQTKTAEVPWEAPQPSEHLGPFNVNLISENQRQNYVMPPLFDVALHLEDGRSLQGPVKDIGFSGLRIRLGEFLPPQLHVTVNLKYEDIQVRLNGKCVWSMPVGRDSQDHITGIGFENVNPEQFGLVRELIFKLAGTVTAT